MVEFNINNGDDVIKEEDYLLLKDLNLQVPKERRTSITVCFWIYLVSKCAVNFPVTLIRQVHSYVAKGAPLLVRHGSKKLMLFPFLSFYEEFPDPNNPTSWKSISHASVEMELPLDKWVHVGCEVSFDFVRLHINGKIVGEMHTSSSLVSDARSDILRMITLVGRGGYGDMIRGYIHNAEFLAPTSSIKDHYFKDAPLQLSIDPSSASEVVEEESGVWIIVGGKASCCFSLDVVLLNYFGHPTKKTTEVIALLVYYDNGAPVEKTCSVEAPLLTCYDGTEFPAGGRPSRLVNGRASFKLRISQLSSDCDNRLFCIKFVMPKVEKYPFFEALSLPVCCIPQSRNPTEPPTETLDRLSSVIYPCNGSQSFEVNHRFSGTQQTATHESVVVPPSKRSRSGQDISSPTNTSMQPDEECHSSVKVSGQMENASARSPKERPESLDETDNSQTDSDSTRNSELQSLSVSRCEISDTTVFKYCLGDFNEKALLLKELTTYASNEELTQFAKQVSLYTGCSHHGNQILIAKKLIEDGRKAWNTISQNTNPVHWSNAVFEIEEQFIKITRCSTRSLSEQDIECLKQLAGSREYLTRENFEKMWSWLYPVALTLSRDRISTLWISTSPNWIEGFITKEEAEFSLQYSRGLQEPGTFVLRFPTSRSWPHPDAGNLVVTFVGSDYNLHHKLLSLDYLYSSGDEGKNSRPLQDLLLEEPELSQLGRIIRSH